MKSIHINPFDQTIKEVDVLDNLEDIYNLLGCRTMDAVGIDESNVLYIDDEGLLKDEQRYFNINGRNLAGNGLVMGFNDEGDTIDTTLKTEDLNITWLPKDHVEQPFFNIFTF